MSNSSPHYYPIEAMHLLKSEQTVGWIEKNWEKFISPISNIMKCTNFSQKSLSAYSVWDTGLSLHLHCFQLSLKGMNCPGALGSLCGALFLSLGQPSLLAALWWWPRCWSGVLTLWRQQLYCALPFMLSDKTVKHWSLNTNFIFLSNNWSLLCAINVLVTLGYTNVVYVLGPCP